jgi:hypothetical protein
LTGDRLSNGHLAPDAEAYECDLLDAFAARVVGAGVVAATA